MAHALFETTRALAEAVETEARPLVGGGSRRRLAAYEVDVRSPRP